MADSNVLSCVRALAGVSNPATHHAALVALQTNLNTSDESYTFFLLNFARIIVDPAVDLATKGA